MLHQPSNVVVHAGGAEVGREMPVLLQLAGPLVHPFFRVVGALLGARGVDTSDRLIRFEFPCNVIA